MLQLKIHPKLIECGTDEAGRGCLAGPVTAAAIILPDDFINTLLNDSKQLSLLRRNELKPLIEQQAIAYSVTHVMMDEIDKINILQASITAMQRSIENLETRPQFIAVDGNKFRPFENIPHQCVVKGDAKFLHIAAASVLAKTYRDAFMEKIHEEYPMYNWKKNKGYPTAEHREAIKKYGITPYHRKSFKLLPDHLEFDFQE
jgi:ribonuclease HII